MPFFDRWKRDEGKRRSRLLWLILCVFSLGIEDPAGADPSFLSNEILVVFRAGTSRQAMNQLHSKVGGSETQQFRLGDVRRIRLPDRLSVEDAIALYQKDPNVLYAEPNYIRRPFVTIPNDPGFSGQWHLDKIDAPRAWDIENTSPTILIAMIDSGVDYTHPDLDENIWTNSGDVPGDGLDNDGNGWVDDTLGWNFVGSQVCTLDAMGDCDCPQDDPNIPDIQGNNDPMDDFGHGTHVAGIAAAEGNNGIGMTGVSWRSLIIPLKIIDRNGCGSVVDEIQAIQYAIDMNADIINASFGGEGMSRAERDAIAVAQSAGILFVAAAGNDGVNIDHAPVFPAAYDLPNLISVSASTEGDGLADFSNFGPKRVDLAAPGECVLSTTPVGDFSLKGLAVCSGQPILSGQGVLSGTSMAAPPGDRDGGSPLKSRSISYPVTN